MAQKRTFVDVDVLVAAFRGTEQIAERAREVLNDPHRMFIGSDLLRLELWPSQQYPGASLEMQFYAAYVATVAHWVEITPDLIRSAQMESRAFNLAASDALHIVAAKEASADEFITGKGPGSPLLSIGSPRIISLWE